MRKITTSFAIIAAIAGGYGIYTNNSKQSLPRPPQHETSPLESYQNLRLNCENIKYHREDYLPDGWIDTDNDCQDTRAEVLISANNGKLEYNKNGCKVKKGLWHDPYSDKDFNEAKDLDIDHIVPLKNAHVNGACLLSSEEKIKFANDYENLLPVFNQLNRQKGEKSPDEWLPPNKNTLCEYLQKWAHIKEKYNLAYSIREYEFFNKNQENCHLNFNIAIK